MYLRKNLFIDATPFEAGGRAPRCDLLGSIRPAGHVGIATSVESAVEFDDQIRVDVEGNLVGRRRCDDPGREFGGVQLEP